MKKLIVLLGFLPFITSCKGQDKIDLFQLHLNETIESLIDFDDIKRIGIETVEYPFCLLIEVSDGINYTFDGIDLTGQKVFFQIDSEMLKTDSLTKQGGGHIDMEPFRDKTALTAILKKYTAANTLYGIRIEMKTEKLKKQILTKLEKKYGKGIKNPNTDNGLYWNLKEANKFIFFAPDYDRLIILNNTDLSKTCYWDIMNGTIDFGGCNKEEYTKELLKNAHPKKERTEKLAVRIDKDWNLNDFVVGKTTEQDFLSSSTNQNFERMIVIDGSKASAKEISYNNEGKTLFFNFSVSHDVENKKNNVLKGYSFQYFKKGDISFENGLRPGISFKDAIKLFSKNEIKNYEDLKFSNYIEIQKENYTVTLNFDGDYLFSGIYIK
ncbi:hypothetical protein [Flavobacterium cerinum]|uniref:Uncharacterized protein n=1 Tax=Flavobacterium cerinum TaxID=2502784 RepID=A0A3S3QWH2_9FLAO|nr:hypothetical protein [Flavobacterium cerinum]RWW96716.1 hypothetical protein EPI11_14070 [Flavobacterium cerinum]